MTPAATKPARILALGDSYTICEGVPSSEGWPAQLADALSRAGVAVEAPRVIARTGWRIDNLGSAMDRAELQPPYSLVTLLIGVNDQFQGFDEPSYRKRFEAMLARAIGLAGEDKSRVIVISIPDYSVTPFAAPFDPPKIRGALERYNQTNREVALAAGVAHVDITPISREAQVDPSLLAPDELHPSGKMYARWVEQLVPVAQEALRKP